MQKLITTEITVLYHYMIEYLLVSKDIEKEMERLTFDEGFNDILSLIIDIDKEENYLTSEMHNNMNKLFMYLSKNNDNYRPLFAKYSSYPKLETGNFYQNQLYLKYDLLDKFVNNKCLAWNIEDMNESVIFDFTAYASLLSDSLEEYINDHFQDFAFNQNFLYFVSKLINQYPTLFKNKDIKLKIQAILMYNDILDNPETEYNFKEVFTKRNISSKREVSDEEYHEKYQEFLKHNRRLLTMVVNNKIYKNSCNILSYITAYNDDIVYNAVYKNGELPDNPLILDNLVKRIDKLGNYEYTAEMKKHLLNLLSDLRPLIGKDQVPSFNECVSKINSTKALEQSNLNVYNANPNDVSGLLRVIIKVYKVIFEEKDIGDKNVYEALNEIFDCVNGTKDFKDLENYEEKLKALFRIYPNVFTNEDVSEKIKESLDSLPHGKRYKRKIKRIQNKRKV